MKIEKNIPITGYRNSSTSPTNILRRMSSGDSVVISSKKANVWRSCATSIDLKIIIRTISATESRVWMGNANQ